MALRGIAICYYSHPSFKQEDSLNWIVTLNQKRYFGNSVRLISTNQTKSNHPFIWIAFCYCHLDAQFRYGSCPKRRSRAPMDSVSFTCLPMILRKQSDSNAYCVLDSVFNLGLQGLFQAEIKQLVELPQRLQWRCAVSLFVLILIVERCRRRYESTEINFSVVQ